MLLLLMIYAFLWPDSDVICWLPHFLLNQVEKAHDGDLHCVDWNPHDNNLILTGYAPVSSSNYRVVYF